MSILMMTLLLLLSGVGSGYYGYQRWGSVGGVGAGLGGVLLVSLATYVLGGIAKRLPMSRLSTYFHKADTQFGVFYPTHYLVAVFPNLVDADSAKRELHKAGLVEHEVISASGDEVVRFAANHVLEDGLWGLLMSRVSRAIGTEALYADADLAAASDGAAFIGVHCPTSRQKTTAWQALETQRPLSARYYAFGGMEHLAGDVSR